MTLRATVPCGSCRACCVSGAIILHPECGDIVETFNHTTTTNPITGKPAFMVKHKPNGECVYLGPDGCTIHDRAPTICREFDCRKAFLKFTRQQRKQLVKSGAFDKATFDAGRERLDSLKGVA